ncbi:MAG: molecular chaperone DnaK, partial [Pseudomonadota bacterium]
EKIAAAIKDLEDAARGGDKAEIDAKVNALSEVSQKLGEKVYADMQAQAGEGAAAGAGAAAGGAQQQAQPQDDNVVDAEFKEVNDKK